MFLKFWGRPASPCQQRQEERLRRQRRQTQRERERSVSRGPRIEEEARGGGREELRT